MNTGRSSLQQALGVQNSLSSNNRFASLAETTEDLMEMEDPGLSQAVIEAAFQEDLPVDISAIQPPETPATGGSRMDISTVADATMNMSVATLDNSTNVTPSITVTPTSTTNPYFQRTRQSSVGVEETKESATPRQTGRTTESTEAEPMEIPGPPTPTGTQWPYYTRMDIILQVSQIGDSPTATSRALSELLQGVFNGTKTRFEIFPWHIASKSLLCIRSPKHVPTHKDKLLVFCHDLFLPARNDGGRRYFKIWVGTDKPFQTYKDEAKPWLTKSGGSIFESTLQVEQPVTLGWLYGSHGDINRPTLARAILKMTGVQVGLKYRAITLPNDRVKGKPTPTAPKLPIRAIHIEIDQESPTYAQDLGKIRAVYASGGKKFPLNLELRLVPMAAGLVDPKSGPKLQSLRQAQGKFADKLKSFTSPDIVALDKEIEKNITLREKILALRPHDTERSDRLFKGVDHHYANWDLVTFTCLQKDGDEALATINSLLPRLLNKAESETMKFNLPTCFTSKAQFAATTVQWNEETGEVQTTDDKIIEAIIEMDLGSDEESAASSKKSVSFKTKSSTKSVKSAVKSTDTSVDISSFGSKTFQRLIKEPTVADADDQTTSDVSEASEATTVTSNKSKADSQASSLTKETLTEKLGELCQSIHHLQSSTDNVNKRLDSSIKEAEDRRQQDRDAFRRALRERDEEHYKQLERNQEQYERNQEEHERNQEEIRDLRALVTTLASLQRSSHQPTDAAAHGDAYTPTGRPPRGSDAAITDPSDESGVGSSL